MERSLSKVVDQALEQALVLCDLDAPRAEAWASDLLSLAAETADPGVDMAAELLRRLDAAGGLAATVAAASVRSLLDEDDSVRAPMAVSIAVGDLTIPDWVDALGTSCCDGAWVMCNWRGASAVFRFIDSAEATHAVAVDLVPGSPEHTGEVLVGPAEIVDLAGDPDSGIKATAVDPVDLARRVVRALGSTTRPRDSLVVNGRLLVSRLAGLVDDTVVIPETAVDEDPDLAPRDPDDDAYALGVLSRALGVCPVDRVTTPEPPAPLRTMLAEAADTLRRIAEVDDPAAQWLAASRGPVELDDRDSRVVIAALAAAVRPRTMVPLDPDAREAVTVLEWADWLGVVIGLVREGAGAAVGPSHMIDLVNQCPEVTSIIPKGDRARVEWALAIGTDLWEDVGISSGGELTELGVWVLPQILSEAWQPSARAGDTDPGAG